MSGLNPLTVAPDEVKVRMYRQGLGDCFLLAFPGDKKPSYVLIDCGLVTSAPNRERIKDVVADIGEATSHHIDLLIVTHEHWDHVSGFLEAADGFKNIEIENLWLAWTEDDTHDLAQKILAERTQRFKDVGKALERSRQKAGMAHIRGLLEFFGDDGLGMGVAGGRGTTAALQQARALCKTPARYCYPKEELAVPGASGVRVYVLGPPLSQEKIAQVDPTAAGHETYTEADGTALDARRSFLMAARYGGTSTETGDDQDLFDLSFPFDKRYRISEAEAKADSFFRQNYGFEAAEVAGEKPGPDWRRIDDDWLDAAEDLALRLDRLTNNTSLALAFELVKSRKVLLFPADAQVGNWMSWHDHTWTVQDGDRFRDVNAQDLLARTVLYKVGHHGSHNATLRDKGLKLMNHPDLVAMVPVDVKTAHEKKRWKRMPFQPLITDLRKRTRGRLLQVDQPLSWTPPEGISEELWKEFLERTKEQPLYFQHTIADEPATPP